MTRKDVVRWIGERAGPLDDLRPLRASAAGAAVVGMGASTRGAHEVFVLHHRVLRFLVEELGFRTLALEEDWTTGLHLDGYVRTGEDDPRAPLAEMWLPWQTEEMLEVISWMRAFNERHPGDPVRFLGLDSTATRAIAYDAVGEYVRRVAPGRRPALDAHYAPLRPSGGIDEHVGRYRRLDDKRPHIEHAERARELVAALPAGEGREMALRHAQAIVDFHLFHARPVMEALPYVEWRMAETLLWWHDHTGSKIAYWGGIAHSAPGRSAGGPDQRNTGGHLRERLGDAYLSMGLTFGRGSVHGGVAVPPPPGDFADSVLDDPVLADSVLADSVLDEGGGDYLLDLRGDRPAEVGAWLDAPGKLRVIGPGYRAGDDADHHIAGGTPGGWLDLVAHTREVTPTRPVPADERAVTRSAW